MRIFVLPGGSSPFCSPKYRQSYADIVDGIRLENPSAEVELLRYPGQADEKGSGMGELNIGSAVDSVVGKLLCGEQGNIRLMCTCFGSIIGANVLLKVPTIITKACFYGPLPFWTLAAREYLTEPSWTNGARGINAGRSITNGGVPFEDFINNPTSTDIRVAIGSDDTVVPPLNLTHYRGLAGKALRGDFVLVPGLPHTVSKAASGWEDYQRQCLSWIAGPPSN